MSALAALQTIRAVVGLPGFPRLVLRMIGRGIASLASAVWDRVREFYFHSGSFDWKRMTITLCAVLGVSLGAAVFRFFHVEEVKGGTVWERPFSFYR